MDKLNFKTAFRYPFNRANGLWNVLWIFLPIIGWFALGGYNIRIVQEFSSGRFEKLPAFNFKNDLKLGFFMFLKSIPFTVAFIITIFILNKTGFLIWEVSQLFLGFFVIPILGINFLNKETVASFFEFKVLKPVFADLGDYVTTLLKEILLAIIFLLMYIVLVGLPAGIFTKNIFLADFYRRKIKQTII